MRHNAPTDMHPPHEPPPADEYSPRTPNPGVADWRDFWISMAILVTCIAVCLGGAYWYFSAKRAAAEESLRQANARLQATAQSHTTTQSDQKSQSGDMPMSGRYPIGPNGKLLRPLDAPTPKPPTKPDNMAFESKEGVEAFGRYVVELLPYSWMSGDTEKWKEISSPDCQFCASFGGRIDDVREKGGWVDESSAQILSSTEPQLADIDNSIWVTEIKVTISEMTGYDGSSISTFGEQTLIMQIQAKYTDRKWRIHGINAEEVTK